MKTVSNFINGSFVEPHLGKYIDSFNPSTGQIHAKIPDSDEYDVARAVESARRAFPEWSEKSPQSRYHKFSISRLVIMRTFLSYTIITFRI